MEISWNDLIVDIRHIERSRLIEGWTWILQDDMIPILVSSIGDMFLSDHDGKIHWLDVGGGELKFAASDTEDLKVKMKDDEIADEWFMFDLVAEIKKSGLELQPGKLFGYKKLPIIGGEYNATNFELTDIEVHFSISGQIHKQIKNLPDGTKVNIKLK